LAKKKEKIDFFVCFIPVRSGHWKKYERIWPKFNGAGEISSPHPFLSPAKRNGGSGGWRFPVFYEVIRGEILPYFTFDGKLLFIILHNP
jgi:hypothetical protein